MFRFFSILFIAAAVGLWILSVALGSPPEFGEPNETEDLNAPLISAARVSFIPPGGTVSASPAAVVPWQGEEQLSSLAVSAPPNTCILVRSGGKTLYTHRADEKLTPASLQKLVTAQAAIQAPLAYPDKETTFSLNYVYKTIAFSETEPVGGVLNGDLYILGGGDPLLSTPEYAARSELEGAPVTQLERLAEEIMQEHALSRIEGSVIAVEDRYDDQSAVSSWPDNWVTGAGTLNSVAVNQGYSFSSESGDAGTLPADPEAALTTAAIFDDMLEARDVVIPFRPEVAPRGEDYNEQLLASIQSAPLREYLKFMLEESDNTIAEMLLKEIGLHHLTQSQRSGGDASTADGGIAVLEILNRRFVDLKIPPNPEPLEIPPQDGSGLSPQNKLTCAQTAAILELDPYGGPEGELASYLPVAGRSGTLKDRFTEPPISGRVKAKTGTLPGVDALAGFAEGTDETWFTFVIIMNHDNTLPDAEVDGIFSEMLKVLTTSKGESS